MPLTRTPHQDDLAAADALISATAYLRDGAWSRPVRASTPAVVAEITAVADQVQRLRDLRPLLLARAEHERYAQEAERAVAALAGEEDPAERVELERTVREATEMVEAYAAEIDELAPRAEAAE